jgi:hypothetical protein
MTDHLQSRSKIALRAKRKIGELTKGMAKAYGPGRKKKSDHPASFSKTQSLAAAGISKS